MRHGQSVANAEHRWVAAPESCLNCHGLTDLGRTQVSESTQKKAARGELDDNMIVIASDYLRAKETAEIACAILGIASLSFDERLRERHCGTLDGRILEGEEAAMILGKIATDDLADPFSTAYGMESTAAVLDRFTRLVAELEQKYEGQRFLLVCHGDLLRIALTAFEKVSPGENEKYGHAANASIYNLNKVFTGQAKALSQELTELSLKDSKLPEIGEPGGATPLVV